MKEIMNNGEALVGMKSKGSQLELCKSHSQSIFSHGPVIVGYI